MTTFKTVCMVEGVKGKPTKKSTGESFGSPIKPGSALIHDGDNSHAVLVKRLDLEEKVHTTKETKGLPDIKNPLQPVNTSHGFFKFLLKAHSGFRKCYLQDYCNLFAFIVNTPSEPYVKIEIFLNMISDNPKLLLYRGVLPK